MFSRSRKSFHISCDCRIRHNSSWCARWSGADHFGSAST
ncbi:hypothetical protein NFI96_015848 [Prochilodus magdalenae]|nr:hypothetical protein NFI96_015848 [Prochilodus magdalenae]